MDKNEKKMTLEEYQEKYTHPENTKLIKSYLFLIEASIGAIIFTCLALLVFKVYDINEYAGYASIILALIVFMFLYIIPIVKLHNTKSFITNVNGSNAKEAKKYNKKLREDIADKMIDIHSKTNDITWYSDDLIGKLAVARNTKNDTELKNTLTSIYNKDVKKACNQIIRNHALKVGVTTALSQNEKIDTMFVCCYDIKLIKDIVYLYGYRPSDAKLLKIYKTVLTNSLIAYGIDGATSSVAKGVVKKIGTATNGLPIIGGVLSTVIDSSLQGAINSSLTVVIGFQTKKYLVKEYKLQDMLDNIELSDEEDIKEEEALIGEVSESLKSIKKKPLAA